MVRPEVEFRWRLLTDWHDLADQLGIPPHEVARFDGGEEARAIWQWLTVRNKLGDLPDALRAIGRHDLADLVDAAIPVREVLYAVPDPPVEGDVRNNVVVLQPEAVQATCDAAVETSDRLLQGMRRLAASCTPAELLAQSFRVRPDSRELRERLQWIEAYAAANPGYEPANTLSIAKRTLLHLQSTLPADERAAGRLVVVDPDSSPLVVEAQDLNTMIIRLRELLR